MIRTRPADPTHLDFSGDEFAPESSLLSIDVRRPHGAAGHGASLRSAWHHAYDTATGLADEDALKADLGLVWMESFVLERPAEHLRFTIRPIGRLPQGIQQLLADGENLPALMEQINHMAMVNCHSVRPASGVVELDDGFDTTRIDLTLLPLISRGGVVKRYLGTLGQ